MHKSPACDYPRQPTTSQIDHPKYREWCNYRADCAAQLVTAATFESWLDMKTREGLKKAGLLPYQIFATHPKGKHYLEHFRACNRAGTKPLDFDTWLANN